MGATPLISDTLKRLHEKGALYIMVGSFLTKLAAFLGSILIVRLLTKADYGVLTSLENIYTYAYVLAGYGLNNAVLRYMVLTDGEKEKKGVLTHALRSGTCFNIALIIVIVVGASVVLDDDGGPNILVLLAIMLLALPLQYAFESSSCSLRALFQNKHYALLSLGCVVVVWALRACGAASFGLEGAVASWPVAYGLMALVGLFLVFRRHLPAEDGKQPDAQLRKSMRSYALQYMITNGLWVLFLQNDILLINCITGSSEMVATYKVAYTIPTAMSIVTYAIGVFVVPYFVKHENDHKWVWRSYRKILLVVCLALGAISFFMALFSAPILDVFFGSQYVSADALMRLLIVSAFINNGIRFTAANLLAAMGKVKVNLIVSAAGMVLQLVSDTVLISLFGIMGAAYSSIIVYSAMAIAITAYFVKRYRPSKGGN